MITGSLQVKKGIYFAVLNLYVDGKRKPRWISTGFKVKGNKKKAQECLNHLLEEYNNYHPCSGSSITVDKYFRLWLDKIKLEVRPNTFRSYYGNMTNHIIPYFENNVILLKELSAQDLEKYYRFKLEPKSKLDGSESLSRTTIKHHHQNMSKALSDAVREGLIEFNPATNAKTPKAEKFRGEYLTPSQTEELIVLFKNSAIEVPVTLCAMYGLRRSEVCGLKWKNVNFETRSILICETLQENTGGAYTDTTKTESSHRCLPMTDNIYNLLLDKKETQKEKRKILGNYYMSSNYVCTMDNGRPITPGYLTKNFHKIITKSSLPDIRLHDLRHSVASNLLSKGFSVVQVADFLGHESPNTTLKFYSHADKTSKMSAAGAMESILNH